MPGDGVTGQHEGILEVARLEPEYTVKLLRMAGVAVDPEQLCSATTVSENANRKVPFERRIDLVTRLVMPEGPLIVPVEAHRRNKQNPAKLIERVRPRWAADFGVLFEIHRSPVLMLVISDCDQVAAEARKPIELGPGSSVRPVSFGPSQARLITDPDDPEATPGSAMLSALLHGNGPNGKAVLKALTEVLDRIDKEEAARRLGTVMKSLEKESAKFMEAIMTTTKYQYHSVWADNIREEGALREARKNLLRVLTSRSLGVSPGQRELIESCDDHERLGQWIDRASIATSSTEVFR